MDETNKEVLTTKEAAEMLHCSQKEVVKNVRNGTFPGRRVGDRYLIPKDALLRYLAGDDAPQEPDGTPTLYDSVSDGNLWGFAVEDAARMGDAGDRPLYRAFHHAESVRLDGEKLIVTYSKNSEVFRTQKDNPGLYEKMKGNLAEAAASNFGRGVTLWINFSPADEPLDDVQPAETQPADEGERLDPRDLVGKRFGHLTVLKVDHVGELGASWYKVRCDCGNEKVLAATDIVLRDGRPRRLSCGRSCPFYQGGASYVGNRELIDETGNRYGKLTVVERAKSYLPHDQGAYWLCRCDCGNLRVVSGNSLRNGGTKDCGFCGRHVEEVITRRDEMALTDIGKKIKRMLEHKKHDFRWLCKKAGVDDGVIRKIRLRENYKPRYETLMKVANALRMTVAELVEGTRLEQLYGTAAQAAPDGRPDVQAQPPAPDVQMQARPEAQAAPPGTPDAACRLDCGFCGRSYYVFSGGPKGLEPVVAGYCPSCGRRVLAQSERDEIERLVSFGMCQENAYEYLMERRRQASISKLEDPHKLRQVWEGALHRLVETNAAYNALFLNVDVLYDDGVEGLRVVFPDGQEFAFAAAQRPDVLNALHQAIAHVIGRDLPIVIDKRRAAC